MIKSKYNKNQSGVTLVLVLAILTILTLLGVSFTFVMRTEMQAAGNYANKLKADYLAELGITAASNRLMSERTDTNGHLVAYSGFSKKSLGLSTQNGSTENGTTNPDVKVQDEESKLNLLVALDTVNRDEWHRLSADNFLYARLSTADIPYNQATAVVSA